MSKTRILTLATVLAASVAFAGLPGGAAAQGAPVLSVTPERPVPGQTVTVVVGGCPTEPVVEQQIRDTIEILAVTPTGTADQWQATTTADEIDANVSGRCGSIDLDTVRIDVENPSIGFVPQGALLPTPNPPEMVYGTDCPDGTTAGVVFTSAAPPPVPGGSPVAGAGDPIVTGPIAIDAYGDWSAEIPAFEPGRIVSIQAACGDVTYPELTFTVPGEPVDPDTTTTTATTTPSSPTTEPDGGSPSEPPVAPPADARPGSASYTG